MNKSISIIVPVYNAEKYLHCCIDSILNQTFTDFEVLLINDGSTDSSGVICDKYAIKDSRVRVFHKENGGVSSARNVGLQNLIGTFIMFLDSDDYLLENSLSSIMSKIETYPQLDMLNFVGVREDCLLGNLEDEDVIIVDFNKVSLKGMRFGSCFHIFRRDLIDQVYFSEDIKYAEDQEFTMKCMAKSKFYIRSSIPIYFYRDNLDSAMNKERTITGAIDHLKVIHNLLSNNFTNQTFISKCISQIVKAFFWYSMNMSSYDKEVLINSYKNFYKENLSSIDFNLFDSLFLKINCYSNIYWKYLQFRLK